MSGLYGNPVGGGSLPKTLILTDENGVEVVGVVVGQKTVFTATDNDVRKGMVYASDGGVSTGTKDIPAYNTTTGVVAIPADSELKFKLDKEDSYDYTELQAMIMPYNSTASDSVAVEKVVINDNVYNTGSTTIISTVSKDTTNKAISFGINNGSTPTIIRYFTYKEEI